MRSPSRLLSCFLTHTNIRIEDHTWNEKGGITGPNLKTPRTTRARKNLEGKLERIGRSLSVHSRLSTL